MIVVFFKHGNEKASPKEAVETLIPNLKMPKLPVVDIMLKQYNQESILTKINLNSVLIDSGTTDCLVSAESLHSAPLTFTNLAHELYLSNALNQKSDRVIRKTLTCNIKIKESDIELVNCTFYVVEHKMSFPAILGMSVLRRLVVNFSTKEINLTNVWSNNLRISTGDDELGGLDRQGRRAGLVARSNPKCNCVNRP